jgi:hypothetical protein
MSNNNPASLSQETYTRIGQYTTDAMSTVINNFFQTAPEGLLFGSTALAVFTQNMAFFILALAVLVFKLLNGVLGRFILEIAPSFYEGETYPGRAKCDFPYATFTKVEGLNSSLRNSAVPSSTTFVFLSTLFYMLSCVHKFKDTLDVLGTKTPVYLSVLPFAFTTTILLSLAYIVWRKRSGCDSISALFLTLFAAAVVAPLVAWAFESIFGKSGVNLLNMPILERDVVIADNIASCNSLPK